MAMNQKETLDLVMSVLDRLAQGESVNKVLEETGVTARVSEAQQSLLVTDADRISRGDLLAKVFYLKKDTEHKDRFKTDGGTKTAMGVYATAKRIIEEGL